MMNCTSPDFKTTAFYKYDSANEILLIRPMKNKWKDFCKTDIQSEESKSSAFNKFNIIRSNTTKKKGDYFNKSYNTDFAEYSLIETVKIYKNNNLEEKINNVYKCEKIKI